MLELLMVGLTKKISINLEDKDMKKIFQYIMLVAAAFAVASCANDIEETTATTSNDNIKFVVGNFPVFDDSQTRAIGTTDAGKTAWAAGDELLVEIENTSYGTQHATFTYDGNSWELSSGELAIRESDLYLLRVYYAPNYKWVNDSLKLKDGKVAGTDEYIAGETSIINNGTIKVSFPDEAYVRNYSRLRIATIANQDITVDVKGFTPARTSSSVSTSYALHSDAKGNAYLYGSFAQNATGVVKYNGVTLATYTFTKKTENKTSYALAATAISLIGMSADEIKSEIQKKLDAGKTDINLMLAPDADITVFENIKSGLDKAGVGSINLTLLGCNKIPSKGLQDCDKLKFIAIPDVTEIEEDAFSDCKYLQKVVLGNITKAYGRPGINGVFERSDSKGINLVLSKEQKYMNCRKIDERYCWTTVDNIDYIDSDSHITRQFLSYEYKSVTCGTKSY